MPNVNSNVLMDNYSQSGDQTLQQIQSGIAASTGVNPGVAEQVRDPSTGKLIKVVLTMPDSAAAQASAVIAANKGVSTVVTAAPSLMITDLDDTDGLSYTGAWPAGLTGVSVFAPSVGELGNLQENSWIDGLELMSAVSVVLMFQFLNNSTIPVNMGLTLKLGNTQTLNIVRSNPIVLYDGTNNGNDQSFWVSQDGKLYAASAGPGSITRTYEQAIQFPPA